MISARNETLSAYRVVTDRGRWRCARSSSPAASATSSCGAATRASSTGSAPTSPTSRLHRRLSKDRPPACSLIGEPEPWRSSMGFSHFTTWSLSVRGRPVRRRRCCLPAGAARPSYRSSTLRQRHAIDPRPHARRRPSATPVGPPRPRHCRRHAAGNGARYSATATRKSQSTSSPRTASTPSMRRGGR